MKTIFEPKSSQAIENRKLVSGGMVGIVFLFVEGFSWHGRHLRRRSQPRRAAHHGSISDRGDPSRETQALQSSRYLSDDGTSLELIDDRTSDGAVVPATSEASVAQGSS